MDGMADITKLIRIYRANDCLWNRKSPAYHNSTLRDSAWRRIGNLFRNSFTIDQLKSQIHKLKRYYIEECLAIKNNRLKGCSHVPRYSFFQELCFLPTIKSHYSANEIVLTRSKCQIEPLSHGRSEQQMRTRVRNEQINSIIEDAFLVDSSRERIPSVYVDFCTKPAYKAHKSSLNPEKLEADHEFACHDSLETNFEDGEQDNYSFCKLILNKEQVQNQAMEVKDSGSYIRAESGSDRYFSPEHYVPCKIKKDDEDEWKDFIYNQETIAGSSRGTRNINKIYYQNVSTKNNLCEFGSDRQCGRDSKNEISENLSRWKYGSNNALKGTRNYDNDDWDIGNNPPSVRYGGTIISSTRPYKYSKDNSQDKENFNTINNSLYTKLSSHSRPKKYLANCRPCSRGGKSYEKYCAHGRRHNQVSSHRLKHELAMQRQNNYDFDEYGHKKQLERVVNLSRHYKRRSSGAERYCSNIHSNPNHNYYPETDARNNNNCAGAAPTMDYYETIKRPHLYSKKRKPKLCQPACVNVPLQQSPQGVPNCQCLENYNQPEIGTCPYFDYHQSQYPQTPLLTNQANYPPDYENPPQIENPPDEPLQKNPIDPSVTASSYNDVEPQIIECPNIPEPDLIEKPPIYSNRNCDENTIQPEYVPPPSFKVNNQSEFVPCSSFKYDSRPEEYIPCPSYKRRGERDVYEDRERESSHSRRRSHRNETKMNYQLAYVQCPYCKDRSQQRHKYDYRGEGEVPQRREADDEIVQCPAFSQISSSRRHSNESYTDRSYAESCTNDQHRERKRRQEDSGDEDYNAISKKSQRQRNQSPVNGKKSRREEGKQTCQKKECPAVKRHRQEEILKHAVEEVRRRKQCQRTLSKGCSNGRSEAHRGTPSDVDDLEVENECSCASDSDRYNREKQKSAKTCITKKGKSAVKHQRPDFVKRDRRRIPSDLDQSESESDCSCETDSDRFNRNKQKSGKTHMTKKGKGVAKIQHRGKRRSFSSVTFPEMCNVAVETDIDMSLKGRKPAKIHNHCTELICYCSDDKPDNEPLLSDFSKEQNPKCTGTRGHGGLSQKTANSCRRASHRTNNCNVIHRLGQGKTGMHLSNPVNRKRQRSGFEAIPKWNNSIFGQPTALRVTKPIVLKSFLIPPNAAKATMGIISNHISNYNQLLQNQQCMANKPVVRCLRRKPIPKPSCKNQLSDHQQALLTNNPLKSIDFNASKREVIILHPPVKDFRPSKNSFGMDDVEVKHLQVPNTEQVVLELEHRTPPTPPATKPKRQISISRR